MDKAEETARNTGPCWGDGLVAPKQCDESFMCELHGRFATTLRTYADARLDTLTKSVIESGDFCESCISSIGFEIRALKSKATESETNKSRGKV